MPRPTAQITAITPWSMLGGRGGCIAAILDEPEAAAPQHGADQKKKSPSRSRFRPQLRLTFRFGSCEPPRTAFRCCFVLLPRRARRKRECMTSRDMPQGSRETKMPQFANVE